jgi:tetratricopeptide (TPR) repeat protein
MLLRGTVIGAAFICCWAGDLGKGMEKFKERDYAAAEQEMRAVVEMEPGNGEALRVLGLSLVRQGKSGEALPLLERAVAAVPDFPDAKLALAGAYAAEKRYDQAEEQVNAAASQKSDHKDLPYYRGMLAVLKKQYREAVPALEKAIQTDPENGYAYYYAGLAYSNTKRPDKMVESFNNFLRLEPKAPETAKVRSFLKSSR